MDYRVIYTLLLLINCVISPIYAKSVDKLDSSLENKESPHTTKDDTIETTDDNRGDDAISESKERIKAEFLTYSAPEEDDIEDEGKIEDLLELLKPKQILLIEAPENTTIIGFDAKAEERDDLAEVSLFGENISIENVNESEKDDAEKDESRNAPVGSVQKLMY